MVDRGVHTVYTVYIDIYSIYSKLLNNNRGGNSMSLFKGAFYLFQTEVKRSVVSSFVVLGLIVFTLLMCVPTYMNILDAYHPTVSTDLHFLADYTFLLTFGSVGVMITFLYGGGFKKDVLADRLAYYRSMPISTEHIVLSKILGALLSTFAALSLFFVANIVGFTIFSDFTVASLNYAYIVHAIALFASMIVINYVFIWFDLCVTYKTYTIISFVFVAIILIATLAISIFTDNSNTLILFYYNFSEQQPLITVVASIVVVLVASLLTFKLTVKGLKNRNLG